MKRSKKVSATAKGAFLLMIATVTVKILGVTFKIPLTHLLGMEGMGYFGAAYQVFGFGLGIMMAGIPPAVAAMVSSARGRKDLMGVWSAYRAGSFLVISIGAIGTAIIMGFARPLAGLVGASAAAVAVFMIAPNLFFSSITAAYRGYDQGCSRMGPVALAQVVEGFSRPFLGLSLAYLALWWGEQSFLQTGMAYGIPVFTVAGARSVSLPYGAAGAVFGVALSEACGTIAIALCHRKEKKYTPPKRKIWGACGEILRRGLPLSLGALVVNITGIIDLGTIFGALTAQKEGLVARYGEMIPNLSAASAPAMFYGAYQTSLNIYALIPAVVAAVGAVSLPAVSEACARGDKKELNRYVGRFITVSNLICMAGGMGIAVLAKPVLQLLYGSRGGEIFPAVGPMVVLGLSLCLFGVAVPCVSMVQGMGKGKVLMGIMVLSSVVKLAVNSWLVPKANLNITGAAWGTFCSQGVLTICLLWYLIKQTGKQPMGRSFVRPFVAAAVCALVARGVCTLSHDPWWVLVAVACGAIAWYVTLWLSGESPLRMLTKKTDGE